MKSCLIWVVVVIAIHLNFEGVKAEDDADWSRCDGFTSTLGAFTALPQTQEDALDQGWEQDDTDATCDRESFKGFRFLHPDNPASAALLYDAQGVMCGIQAWVRDNFTDLEPSYKFKEVKMYQHTTFQDEDYWALTAYFADPASICDQKEARDLSKGTFNSFIFQNGPTPDPENLLPVPFNRADAPGMGWDNENCFQTMGWHNFQDVSDFKDTDCTSFTPALVLYDNDGKCHGGGFWFYGQEPVQSSMYERPPGSVIDTIMDDAPDCITSPDHPSTTIHFWCIQDPQDITCQ